MKRGIRVAVATTALAVAGLLGLSACGTAGAAADLSPEAAALTQMGFTQQEVAPVDATAAPSPGADGRKAPRRRALRVMLRRNTLHGEATVQTRDGVKTIDVQRGTVTAVGGGTVTVRSTDGFTGTWKLGSPLRVRKDGRQAQASDIKVGETVGLAGLKDGGTVTARLVIIRDR